MKMKLLSPLVLLNFLLSPRDSQQATYKDFTVQKALECPPVNEIFSARISDLKAFTSNDSMLFRGKITVLETLPMNIAVEVTITRCNLDGTGCSFFDKFTYPRLCEKISATTSVAYKIVSGIYPQPVCPIAVGVYEMVQSRHSFAMFKTMPLEGYLWQTRIIFHEKKGNRRLRKLACLEYDVAIVIKSQRPKNRN